MYNSRKKSVVEMPLELTTVWSCSNENCKVWMRDNFTFSLAPICTQCKSLMVKTEKEIEVVENNSPVITKKV